MTTEEQVLAALANLLAKGQKNNPASTQFSSSPYAHGNTGLFSDAGAVDGVFSTIAHPTGTLAEDLPVMPMGTSVGDTKGGVTAEEFTTLTGVTAGANENIANMPTNNCDDWPLGGLLKAATVIQVYGRVGSRIRINQNEVGRIKNRGEATSLRALNGGLEPNKFMPTFNGLTLSSAMHREFHKKAFETFMGFKRFWAGRMYVGTPTNNTAGGGYKETIGMELQVNTGRVDKYGQLVPSLDSYVHDYADGIISATNSTIVELLVHIYNYLRFNASSQGMGDVLWKLVMHPELFRALSKIWPVDYYHESLNRIANFAGGRVMLSGQETMNFRNEMLRGSYLPLGEFNVPVVQDNSMALTTGGAVLAGNYSGDIYIVPYTVLGGMPVTYWEFFDQNNPEAAELDALMGTSNSTTSDGGKFRWYRNDRNGCIDFNFFMEPRLVMRTPQLAARITDCQFETILRYRDWNPSSSYHFNGGRTNLDEVTDYTEWSTDTPVVIGR